MDPARHPSDIAPRRTADGSRTLYHGVLNEPYHSLYGAVQESTHVFIRAGLETAGLDHARVLEVGLGTGLNMVLTWIRCLEGKLSVDYVALEPFPVPQAHLEALRHCEELAWPGLHEPFLALMSAPAGEQVEAEGGLLYTRYEQDVRTFVSDQEFDVVYFDAFAPDKQPHMWTASVFQRMFNALVPGGMLVTYCAKGEVRRTLLSVGFHVEKLPGPPGKREMLRALRPLRSTESI